MPETMRGTAHTISVIVPTRNEAGNVRLLVERLRANRLSDSMEIIFVDDSDDATPEVIESLQKHGEGGVRLIHREGAERTHGLGGAVVAGMRAATGTWICVIDGDLQHPPELIDRMLERANEVDADVVVASRYCAEGDGRSLGALRSLLSRGTTLVTKTLFPRRLHGVSDPMSGFFMFRRSEVDPESLKPHGFKILLEVLVRSRPFRIAEVPFEFGARHAGESKASLREGLRFVTQLGMLQAGRTSARFAGFAGVGISGLAVNTALLAAFTELGGIHYLLSAILATQGSTAWNFALTELWVYKGKSHDRGPLLRLAAFYLMNNLALWLRGPLLVVLTSGAGINYLLSNLVTMGGLTILRFGLADRWIWRASSKSRQRQFLYNVHDLISVDSDTWLPELERFQVEGLAAPASIRVRTGRLDKTERTENGVPTRICYDEGLGPLGFGATIERGEQIEVVVTPLVRRSPHVLYTNVVEPILRWLFVERGYALVHGACLATDDGAYLITARTDTGKTTTILKTLDHHAWAFLSDDLTLVAPDGRVLMYPKPMTISRHTVHAVKTPLLSPWERFTLIFQSRLHSRSGRKFAMFLIRTHLPVATVNTIVQLLVPPPKYHVERLIPNVRLAREAQFRGLIIIQRGEDGRRELEADEALQILMENCEDAYGFPPYHTIEHFLHSSQGKELRAAERNLVASVLAGNPATLLSSSRMDWAERLPSILGVETASAPLALAAGAFVPAG